MAIVTKNDFYSTQEGGAIPRKRNYSLEINTETGETKVFVQTISTVLGQDITSLKIPMFVNGWNGFSSDIKPEDKDKILQTIKSTLTELKKDPKNKMPGFFTQGFVPAPDDGSGFLMNAYNAIMEYPNLDDYNSSNMKNIFKDILKYPTDIINEGQDILRISQYTYRPPYLDVVDNAQTQEIGKSGIQRGSALKERIGTIILPIPNNVSDSNSTGWGPDSIDSISLSAIGNQAVIGGLALNKGSNEALNNMIPGGGDTIINMLSMLNPTLGQAAGALGNISNIMKDNPQLAYGIITQAMFNPTLNASLRSMILSSVGFEVSPETILSRGYGVVPNSNLELLFSGPTLRSFQFGYNMTPRDKKEAETCRKILRFFKQGMTAKKNQKVAPGYGGPSFLLGTPNVFKLSYETWSYDKKDYISIKGLNKFKVCALTNINTSYAEGSWAAYEEGQPVRMMMQLVFKELEPVYESDYNTTAAQAFIERLQFQQNKKDQKIYEDLAGQSGVQDDEIGY